MSKTGKSDENYLGSLSKEKILRNILASDCRKEGAVVCLGSTAIHFKGEWNLNKIDTTIDMLIATHCGEANTYRSIIWIYLVLNKKIKTLWFTIFHFSFIRVKAFFHHLAFSCLRLSRCTIAARAALTSNFATVTCQSVHLILAYTLLYSSCEVVQIQAQRV